MEQKESVQPTKKVVEQKLTVVMENIPVEKTPSPLPARGENMKKVWAQMSPEEQKAYRSRRHQATIKELKDSPLRLEVEEMWANGFRATHISKMLLKKHEFDISSQQIYNYMKPIQKMVIAEKKLQVAEGLVGTEETSPEFYHRIISEARSDLAHIEEWLNSATTRSKQEEYVEMKWRCSDVQLRARGRLDDLIAAGHSNELLGKLLYMITCTTIQVLIPLIPEEKRKDAADRWKNEVKGLKGNIGL